MKVVFYTRPGYLDQAFSLVSALTRQAELHLIVEVSPEGRRIGAFSLPPTYLPAGLCLAMVSTLATPATFAGQELCHGDAGCVGGNGGRLTVFTAVETRIL